jgi:hypothetical protein
MLIGGARPRGLGVDGTYRTHGTYVTRPIGPMSLISPIG